MLINSSTALLDITASPLRALYATFLHQKLKESKLSAPTAQANGLSLLRRHETVTNYIIPAQGSIRKLSLVIFANDVHLKSFSQLCFITSMFIGPLQQESILHLLSWSLYNSLCRVCHTATVEILATNKFLVSFYC